MRKLLPLIAGIFFAGSLFAQAVPDGRFETWNVYTWMDPQYYNSSNEQIFNNGGNTPNVTRAVPGYHGNYAVSMVTTAPGGVGGYIINANANNGNFKGGIAYNQEPTGLRVYYQYAPNTNDTAALLVLFKRSGSIIDSFLVMITTPSGGYSLHQYTRTHPFPITPDTVIVGALSSIGILKTGQGHPGSVFVIDSLTFTGGVTQPSDLNGDFENWTPDTSFVPNYWYANYPGVTRTTDAQTGEYALQVSTVNYLGDAQVGNVATGYYTNCQSNCHELGGQPYTRQIDTLDFAFKYIPHGTDTAVVQLNFIKNGNSVNGTSINLFGTTAAYKDTILPFNLPSAPDSVIVSVTSSSHNHDTTSAQYAPYIGSVLKLDNMTFASQKHTLSVNNLTVTSGVKVYPNPVTNVLNVEFTNLSGAATISLYDITGREIKQSNIMIDDNIVQLNTSGMSTGIYFYRITTQNGSFENKFVKE